MSRARIPRTQGKSRNLSRTPRSASVERLVSKKSSESRSGGRREEEAARFSSTSSGTVRSDDHRPRRRRVCSVRASSSVPKSVLAEEWRRTRRWTRATQERMTWMRLERRYQMLASK